MATSQVINSCQLILETVRSSNINFMIQETPYSIYLTLRKSAAKSQTSPWIQTQAISALKNELERVIFDSESLANKCKTLDHEKASLTKDLEEEICHSLNIKSELKTALDALQNVAVRLHL